MITDHKAQRHIGAKRYGTVKNAGISKYKLIRMGNGWGVINKETDEVLFKSESQAEATKKWRELTDQQEKQNSQSLDAKGKIMQVGDSVRFVGTNTHATRKIMEISANGTIILLDDNKTYAFTELIRVPQANENSKCEQQTYEHRPKDMVENGSNRRW